MRRSKSKGQPAAKWVNQRQEAAIKVSQLVLFLILLGIRMQMVKAAEAISIHRESGPYNRDRSRSPVDSPRRQQQQPQEDGLLSGTVGKEGR